MRISKNFSTKIISPLKICHQKLEMFAKFYCFSFFLGRSFCSCAKNKFSFAQTKFNFSKFKTKYKVNFCFSIKVQKKIIFRVKRNLVQKEKKYFFFKNLTFEKLNFCEGKQHRNYLYDFILYPEIYKNDWFLFDFKYDWESPLKLQSLN